MKKLWFILVCFSIHFYGYGQNLNVEGSSFLEGSVSIGPSSTVSLNPPLLTVNGNTDIDGNVRPLQDDTYDLGGIFNSGPISANFRWDDVYATNGTINTSDRKDKENIQKINYGLQEIMQLKPVKFTWKNRSERGVKLGLIAQDVQEVLSEVVKTFDHVKDSSGNWKKVELERLGIYYSDIIPVLISGIQEQQEMIEAEQEINVSLKEKVNLLEQENQSIREELNKLQRLIQQVIDSKDASSSTVEQTITTLYQPATLKQNQPNPFSKNTVIEYDLPKDIDAAQLQITNQKGQLIKSILLDKTGKGQVELKSKTLSIGTYFYSLIVDGKVVDTKQMVLTK